MTGRILLHIGFWLVYLFINGYIEVALVNYSWFDLPIWDRIVKGFGAELAVLPLKMGTTYFIMYVLIPKYIFRKKYLQFFFFVLALMIVAIVLYRLTISYFIFPFIYEETYESHPFLSMLPRHLWTILDFFSVAGIAGTIKMTRMRIYSLEKEKQLVEEKLRSELNFLRAQINPHFLFNTLNNIYALARKKSDKTADLVMRLSKMLRFILYESTSPYIPLKKELKLIRDYIELEKLRYDSRLEVVYEERIEDNNHQITPLLLLPFVENAFKHGASESRFEASIYIRINVQKGLLNFEVSNSKDSDTTETESGIGLNNVKRRLSLLYPENHNLEIINQNNRYIVRLSLKLSVNEIAEMSDR